MFLEKIEKIPVIQVHIYKQLEKVWTNLGGWIERNIDLNVQFQFLAENLNFQKKLKNFM